MNFCKRLYIARVFAISVSLFSATISSAQNVSINHYDISNGLSNNSVTKILQDDEGYIWIGTKDGLNRFNGYEFLVFRSNPSDTNSISDSFIGDIVEDDLGNIWIGTAYQGVNKINKENYAVSRLQPQKLSSPEVYSLAVWNNYLFIGTYNGLDILNINSGELKHFLQSSLFDNDLFANRIRDIHIDSKNRLWIGTWKYTFAPISLNTDNIFASSINEQVKVLLSNATIKIRESHSGEIFITNENGLFRYNEANKNSTNLISQPVFDVITQSENQIWGISNDGIHIYDKNHKKFIAEISSDNSDLESNNLNIITCDRNGLIWVGTEDAGINTLVNHTKIKHYKVPESTDAEGLNTIRSLTFDNQGNIWAGSESDGMVRYSTTNYEYEIFKKELGNLPTNRIYSLLAHNHKLYIGTRATASLGFYIKDLVSGKIVHENHSVISNPSRLQNTVTHIYKDSKGMLWLGTYHGIEIYNPATRKFIAYYSADKGQLTAPEVQSGGISEEGNGIFWVASWGGITRIDIGQKYNYLTPKFTQFKSNPVYEDGLKENRTIEIYAHSQSSNVFIGTYGGGLYKYTGETSSFQHYTTDQGLPSNVIYEIQEDNEGKIWMATNKGISKFDLQKNKFTNFGSFDGLQSEQFNWGASAKSSDGKLAFGGVNGINVFYPGSFMQDTSSANISIDNLYLQNKLVEVNENIHHREILPKRLNKLDRIVIPYRNRIFSIEVASLYFANPEKNLYRYKLQGFDDEWIHVSSKRRFLTYTNLPPRTYKLQVQATNSNGVWSDTERSIDIVIKPPFWRSIWFISITSILLLIALTTIYRIRSQQVKLHRRKLEQLVKQRTIELENQKEELSQQRDYANSQHEKLEAQKEELEKHKNNLERLIQERTSDLLKAKEKAEASDRLKSAFLANISHEIRTPLNSILGFSGILCQPSDLDDEERERCFHMVESSSKELLNLINDILDISKIDSGDLVLNIDNCHVNNLLQDLYDSHLNYIQHKHIKNLDLLVEKLDEDLIIKADSLRIKQVLNNIIYNGIKFTERGYVRFGARIKDVNPKIIQFYVQDTGIGIPVDKREEIFERFMKVESSTKKLYRGAGLGLTISKKVITLMQGEIILSSEVGKGTTFIVNIPLNIQETLSEQQAPRTSLKALYNVDWSGKTFLIAEDEDSNFNYLQAILKKTKVNIVRAFNGDEAIQLVKKQKFDLVLMDMQMPDVDGYEATKFIKSINPKLPIIAQTAYAMANERQRGYEAGCDEYLPKPFLPKDLTLLIKFL
jgi:signal transduction histidine kinase/ligand-binding sensor domain-containing protein/CheY-like chemotaxis protein